MGVRRRVVVVETLRNIYDIADHTTDAATVVQFAQDLQDPAMPAEIDRLGRTLWRWRTEIANWHAARVNNAATEAANNLVKRVERAAFGLPDFANFRIRALLYAGKPNWSLSTPSLRPDSREAGKPNWSLLDTLTPT